MIGTAVVGLTACGIDMPKETQSSFETMTVEKSDIELPYKFSARMKGQNDVTVTPQVSGQLTKICVAEGQQVKKGQTLFIIDQRNAQLELEAAQAFCRERGIRQNVISAEDLNLDGVRHNPPDRCYHCKKEIFGKMLEVAAREGIAAVAEGSNMDDIGDYRPGMRAIQELKILSPLLEAGLTKQDIRALSRELGLSTWDKPSFACLASRFVYGETITDEKLRMVDRAEQLLLELGFRQFRVRIHGNLARIELLQTELHRAAEEETREIIVSKLKEFGFSYVTLDLAGYRTGSMNEGLRY